ncbi:S8 family peptidase [Hymenobacter ginkgonis]|uniref:S8 family peptidase n=1 Tax=Hymenobacter ginkgonis TaxID=2682976 RepID=UPI0018DBB243|nr:S8 family peptidase [Hymenobacter ginkgonis]
MQPALRALAATGLTQKFPFTQVPSPEQPGSVDLRLIYHCTVPTPLNLAKARALLLATGAVEYVEPVYVRAPFYQPNDPRADSTQSSATYLKLINAYRGWDATQGDTSIVIGITDTGFRLNHEDLVRQIKYNYADPINGIDDDKDGYIDNFRGWDMAHNNNDPSYESVDVHGSMSAGLAAAQANNGKGFLGVGFGCKWLPLQIFPGSVPGAFAGYEAIVYAADHGCQIINMSWGGVGGYSRFEQDVCTYAAVNRDAVLVAAAGNTPANVLVYPASYDHVLAVAATDGGGVIAAFSTYNTRVDLAATGVEIPSTGGVTDTDYRAGTGTSFSAPQVAGAAALVRARFPQLRAEQVRAQLRRTANAAIYNLPANVPYIGLLGTGTLNVGKAVAALNQREARVVQSTYLPAKPTGYTPGDTISLAVTVRNLLLPISGLTVTLTSQSPYVTVRQGTFAVGNLATLTQATNEAAPFRLAVAASGVPVNTSALLRYHFVGSDGYQADQYVTVLVNPDFAQLDAGDLSLSLTSRGNLGYDDLTAAVGLGARYRDGEPLLSEGGLLLATSPTRVADRLRSRGSASRQSFFTLAQAVRLAPGPRADQEVRGTFRDSLPDPQLPRSVGVRVRQHGQSWATPAARRNLILLDYSLRNLTADTLKALYAGIFTDWDLPGNPGLNVARWDSVNRLSYCFDPVASQVYTGVQVLGPRPAGVYAINNGAPAGTPIYLADGFSPAEKYLALSGGFGRTNREAGANQGADVSTVVSTLVPRLAPGDSATVAFAVLAAPSLAELQAAAQAAAALYTQQVLATVPAAPAVLGQVYPNPTTGELHIRLPTQFGPATAQVLDALGRVVVQATLPATGGEITLAALPAGLYLLRVAGPAGSLVQRIVRE